MMFEVGVWGRVMKESLLRNNLTLFGPGGGGGMALRQVFPL